MDFDFIEYMRNIARTHKDIAWDPDGDEKKFFRISSVMNMDELIMSLGKAASPCIIAENSVMGRLQESSSWNFGDNRNYSFMVLKKVEISNMDDYESAMKDCRAIADSIYSKMLKDYADDNQGGDPRIGLRNLDLNSPFYQSVGPFGDTFVGIFLQFTILHPMNAAFKYKKEDWNEIPLS